MISRTILSIKYYWQLLTSNFQEVFKSLKWFSKTFSHNFVSLDTLAENSKCSRRTVIRAINFFVAEGWVIKIKRPYQSNMYILDNELLDFDVKDINNFKREPVTQDGTQVGTQVGTVLEQSYSPKNCTSTEDVPYAEKKEEKQALEGIHPCIVPVITLSPQEKAMLSNRFTEQHLANAVDDARWFEKQGKRIQNILGFLISQANKSFNRLKPGRI